MGLEPNIHRNANAALPPDFTLDLRKNGRMSVQELVDKLDAGERIEGYFPDPDEGEESNATCPDVHP